jgi:hypothetical protein
MNNENKRLKSTKEYIDALQDKYSKLNVVRIDLAYKKPYSEEITLDDANEEFTRLLNNRRGKPSIFKHNVGYICKKEYTKDKGVHLHTAFFFDGQKVKQDTHIANELGKHWRDKTTKGRGTFYNCNQNKQEYEKIGIGMLDHKDKDKREILDEKVIVYLCKDDEKQDIAPVKSNKKDRAFVRGTMPKKKGKAGRPRKK